MNHLEVINKLIEKYNYKSYLEIGIYDGDNFSKVNIENKESNDISSDKLVYVDKLTYEMTSDEMFSKMPLDKKYDIIFIDGMHDEQFVDRDIINSLKHLNKGGVICVHDVIPKNRRAQENYYDRGYIQKDEWNGDVWKSITKLQDQNIEFYTLRNYDYGLTIIKYRDNFYDLTVPNYLSKLKYDYLFNDTNDFNTCLKMQGIFVLHVITEEQFNLFV